MSKEASVAGPGFTHSADGGIIKQGTTNQKTITYVENFAILDGQDIDLHAVGGEKAQLALDTQGAERTLEMNENLTVGDGEAGTITFSAAGKTITIPLDASVSGTNTGDQNLFSTIAVAGQDSLVADAASDTLTVAAGTGITLATTAGSDTLTISATGAAGWSELVDDLSPLVVNTRYCANKAGTICACVLPATFAIGDKIEMKAKGATLFKITAAAGDAILLGGISTKAGGYIQAQTTSDSVVLECITADTTWLATGGGGTFIIEDV